MTMAANTPYNVAKTMDATNATHLRRVTRKATMKLSKAAETAKEP